MFSRPLTKAGSDGACALPPRLRPWLKRWTVIAMRIVTLLAVLLAWIGPSRAAFEEPTLIAERVLDLERGPKDGLTTEFIDIAAGTPVFAALMVESLSGDVTVKGLRLSFADGQTRDLAVDRLVRGGQRATEVVLGDGDPALTRIEVLYQRPPPPSVAGRVTLRIYGRKPDTNDPAGGSGQSAARPAAPGGPSGEASARLVLVASKRTDLARADITVSIPASKGAISLLQVRAKDIPLIVRQITVIPASGEPRVIKVGQLVEAGGASKIIDVVASTKTAPQALREVIVQIRAGAATDTGTIELWGDPEGSARPEVAAVAPPPAPAPPPAVRPAPRAPEPPRVSTSPGPRREELPPPTAGEPDDDPDIRPDARPDPRAEPRFGRPLNNGWRLLATARDEDGRRSNIKRAVFSVRRVDGQIAALRFIPRRDVVELRGARVEFEDGSSERLDVRGYALEPGQMTEVLPIRSRGLAVVSIEVSYRPTDRYQGPASLELWAEVLGGRSGEPRRPPGRYDPRYDPRYDD